MKRIILIPGVIAFATCSIARGGLITFSTDAAGNTLAPGTTIAEQYAAIGVHFVGSAFDEPTDPHDVFADNTDMQLAVAGGDVPRFANIPAGAGNFLHTYSGFVAENGDANFAIEFDTPITSCSVDLYDDTIGLSQMFAIEGEDILDDAQSTTTTDGAKQTLTVSSMTPFTVVGLILGTDIDWVAADNVSYTMVPEPSAVAIFGAALGVIRRRRLFN